MKAQRLFRLGLVLFLMLATMASSGVIGISALFNEDEPAHGITGSYPPNGGEPPDTMNTTTYALAGTGPIIADHTVVDQYDGIPQEYMDKVKTMWLNVPGESHSSGYRKGLQFLDDLDSRFPVSVTESAPPEPYTDQHLRVSRITRSAAGWNAWGYGEADWYTNADAITKTKYHLTYANTNGFTITAMGFGWCWDMTWHNSPTGTVDPVYQVRWAGSSEGGPDGDMRWGLDAGDIALTGNRVTMDTYLSATQQYIDHAQANGYPTKVFFTTGPVDGYSGESGYQRQLKHEYIRNYVLASSDRILFDYADILSWSNAGQQNLSSWTDYGSVSKQYQMIHSDNMLDLDGTTHTEDGDHIGPRGALRLGKALWWMLARIAGWDGTLADMPRKSASATALTYGQPVTYTVVVGGLGAPLAASVAVTDIVPSGLAYVSGTLTATQGMVNAASASTLLWSGTLSPTGFVTITYAVTVTSSQAEVITNTAVIAASGYAPVTRTAAVFVNPYRVYLPLVVRNP